MSITVPLRARKSNSSWVPWRARPSRRRAIARLTRRPENGKYFFSVGLFVFMTGALSMSVVGGVIENASAERNYRNGRGNSDWAYYQRTTRDTTPDSRQNQSEQHPQQNQSKQEKRGSQATKTAPPVSTAKAEPTPATVTPVQQVTRTSETVTTQTQVSKRDTGPEIAKMSAAKADTVATPVTYPSQRITEDTRDHLLMVSGAAMVVSFLMYAISLIGSGPKVTPATLFGTQRYQIPIKEIVTN